MCYTVVHLYKHESSMSIHYDLLLSQRMNHEHIKSYITGLNVGRSQGGEEEERQKSISIKHDLV